MLSHELVYLDETDDSIGEATADDTNTLDLLTPRPMKMAASGDRLPICITNAYCRGSQRRHLVLLDLAQACQRITG